METFISRVIDKFSPANFLAKIPPEAPHPGYEKAESQFIQLGVGAKKEAVWNTHKSGNLLITGMAGRGKTVTQDVIIKHCLHHSDSWQVKAFSLHEHEFSLYMQNETSPYDLATTVEDGVRLLREVKEMIEERFEILGQANRNFSDLSPKLRRVLVAIDQIDDLIGAAGSLSNTPFEELRLKDEAHELLNYIAANGRAAGINLVVSAHSHENKMCGQLASNFYPIIEFGQYPKQSWESHSKEIMPPLNHLGRAYISTLNGPIEFQAYYHPYLYRPIVRVVE